MKKIPDPAKERLARRTLIYPARIEPECCFHGAQLIQFTTPGNKFVGVTGRLHQCALWRGPLAQRCWMVDSGLNPLWSVCTYNPSKPPSETAVQLMLDFGY